MLRKGDSLYILLCIVGFALVCGSAFFMDNYYLQVGTTLGMFGALAFGWNIVGGYMGYPSLGTAALFGLGVYGCAIAQVNGVPMFAAWVIAGLLCLVFAALIGGVILPLRGHYFAIGTIGAVGVLHEVAGNWNSMTGGSIGLNLPLLEGDAEFVGRFFFIAMWLLAAGSMLIVFLVDRSRLGFGLRCIKQNEDAASMIGLNVFKYKVIAFALSAVICGLAGAIYASMIGFVEPQDAFNIELSIEIPVVAMIGGLGTLTGPLIGSVLYLVLREVVWSNLLHWHDAALGVLIVIVIYLIPNGLLSLVRKKLPKRATNGKQAPKAENDGVQP